MSTSANDPSCHLQAEALEAGVSLTSNFLSTQAQTRVLPLLQAYVQRRSACEQILGRRLRASDNLMKFCCHGGQLPSQTAHSLLAPFTQASPEHPAGACPVPAV